MEMMASSKGQAASSSFKRRRHVGARMRKRTGGSGGEELYVWWTGSCNQCIGSQDHDDQYFAGQRCSKCSSIRGDHWSKVILNEDLNKETDRVGYVPSPQPLFNTMAQPPPNAKKMFSRVNSADLDYDSPLTVIPDDDVFLTSDSPISAGGITLTTKLKIGKSAEHTDDVLEIHFNSQESIHLQSNSNSSLERGFLSHDSPNTYSEDLKKNREYFENLRRCYDLDDIVPPVGKMVATRDSHSSFKEVLMKLEKFRPSKLSRNSLLRSSSSGNIRIQRLRRSLTNIDLKKQEAETEDDAKESRKLRRKAAFTTPKESVEVFEKSDNLISTTYGSQSVENILRGIIRTSMLVDKARHKIKTKRKSIQFEPSEETEKVEDVVNNNEEERLLSPEPEKMPRKYRSLKYSEINKVILGNSFIRSCQKSMGTSHSEDVSSDATADDTYDETDDEEPRIRRRSGRLQHESIFDNVLSISPILELASRTESEAASRCLSFRSDAQKTISVEDTKELVKEEVKKPKSNRRIRQRKCRLSFYGSDPYSLHDDVFQYQLERELELELSRIAMNDISDDDSDEDWEVHDPIPMAKPSPNLPQGGRPNELCPYIKYSQKLKRVDTGARLVVPNDFRITPTKELSSNVGTPKSQTTTHSPLSPGDDPLTKELKKSISSASIDIRTMNQLQVVGDKKEIFKRQDTNAISLAPADFSIKSKGKESPLIKGKSGTRSKESSKSKDSSAAKKKKSAKGKKAESCIEQAPNNLMMPMTEIRQCMSAHTRTRDSDKDGGIGKFV